MAERVGFEPTSRFLVNTLSKRAPSATRTPLRGRESQNCVRVRRNCDLQTTGRIGTSITSHTGTGHQPSRQSAVSSRQWQRPQIPIPNFKWQIANHKSQNHKSQVANHKSPEAPAEFELDADDSVGVANADERNV